MTIFDMLGQSGILAILGMGVVFGFLLILVIVISLAGKIITGLFGNDTDALASETKTGTGNAKVTAAITAAINEYQKKN